MKKAVPATLLALALSLPALAETVSAIDHPELEPSLNDAAVTESEPAAPSTAPTESVAPAPEVAASPELPLAPPPEERERIKRDHAFNDMSIEGDINQPRKKRRKVIIVEEPELTITKRKNKSIGNKIDEALERKIVAIHKEINDKVVKAVEGMKVDVQ